VGRHVCKKLGLKNIAQGKTDNDFQLTRWNKKRSTTQMTKLYAECLRNHKKQTEPKERRSGEKRTSNEPTKEGRHPNKPKSKGEDVEIIVIEEEPESADITEKSVESAVREKSIPSDNSNEKVIENAKNNKKGHAKTEIESVRDKDKVALNCERKSQNMTKTI